MHSPFVFDFIVKGLNNNNNNNNNQSIDEIEEIRRHLLKNHQKITIEDFGAGSKIFKNNERTIRQIVQHVALSPKKVQILFKIINYFKPNTILELGTSIGLGTTTIAHACPMGTIITVEGCKNLIDEAIKLFDINGLKNIAVKNETFDSFIENNTQIFDVILFDGHHTYEATIKYFEELLESKHNNSFWIFDDIHWSKDMEKAWRFIKDQKDVTVTIDLFHYGIVFFRQEQIKQHFVIRP